MNEDAVIDFLQEHIMARFGVPISLVFDNASYFSSIKMTEFSSERGILQARINTLLKLEESRLKSKERFKDQHEIVKTWFDKHKSEKGIFEVGDLVLKWDHSHDEKGKHTKFQHLRVGPFQIAKNLGILSFNT